MINILLSIAKIINKIYNSDMVEKNYKNIICPICGESLQIKNKSLYCTNNHCFDIAHSGYINLLPSNLKNSNDPGDNKEMIKARQLIMDKGYYDKLANCITSYLKLIMPENIIDTGCGIGNIANKLKTAFPNSNIIGTDISKPAIEIASKRFKDITFAVAGSNKLPIQSETIDIALCTFAPFFSSELLRTLKPHGLFIRVIPNEKHLYKLKSYLYEKPYLNDLDDENIDGFEIIKTINVVDEFTTKNDEIIDLIKMTPYYYNTSYDALNNIKNKNSITTNLDFLVRVYKKY